MLPGDFIAMRLTGDIVTTVSGLSEGIFWDFKNNALSEELMNYYGFSKDLIADIRPTFGLQGEVTASVAAELGLKKGTAGYLSSRAIQPNNALSLNVLNPGRDSGYRWDFRSGVWRERQGELRYAFPCEYVRPRESYDGADPLGCLVVHQRGRYP